MTLRKWGTFYLGLIVTFFLLAPSLSADIQSQVFNKTPLTHEWRKSEFHPAPIHRDTTRDMAPPAYPNPRVFQEIDALNYTIDIHLNPGAEPYPNNAYITATATIRAKAKESTLTEVVIDFYNTITITSFRLNAVEFSNYTRSDDKIRMNLTSDPLLPEEEFEVSIDYSCVIGSAWQGLLFRRHPRGNPSGVYVYYSMNQPYMSPGWYPCFDYPSDKVTADLYITCADWMTVVANGLPQPGYPIDNGDGTKTHYWKESYQMYTSVLTVDMTDYYTWTDTYTSPLDGTTMPLTYYVFPEDKTNALATFPINNDALAFYAQKYGEYPFINEKYGIAEVPNPYGSMEHQTITALTYSSTRNPLNWDVIVHELAHQWWGDWVTCKTWNDVWVHEGFATYSEILFHESYTGKPAGTFISTNYDDGLYDGNLAGTVYAEDIGNPFDDEGAIYDKGGWVLHMLRHMLGNTKFFAAVKAYGLAHAYANANTDDVRTAMEAQYGSSLVDFFNQWIYTPYRPIYSVLYEISNRPGGYKININLNQTQPHWVQDSSWTPLRDYYIMPVDFTVHYKDLTKETFTVLNNQRNQNFQILTTKEPDSIVFDEDINILKVKSEVTAADYKYNYYDYQEMATLLQGIETQSSSKTPDVYSLQIIGYSYENRPIYAVKFSDNPGLEEESEPVIVIDGGIHGNEWLPVDSNINFIQHLFNAYYDSGYSDHTEIVDLVNNFQIWIIPMINVDGRVRDDLAGGDPDLYWTTTTYHTADTAGWRMNVQVVPCAAMPGGTNQGIDLNRNFSDRFWELSNCTKNNYSGSSAFIAPENRALKQFINNHMVSLVLHQHSNAQIIYSASAIPGLGAYLSDEADIIYEAGLPNPLMALTNMDLGGGAMASTIEKSDDKTVSIMASGACNGSAFTGQYYTWLWSEVNCTLAPDNYSRRAIQNVFYEYAYEDVTPVYGYIGDGKVGQYVAGDGSNGFHPSSGEMNQWIIEKSVEMNKYLIKQSRYPFSPRHHTDMSLRYEAPITDLAIVGAKISRAGIGLPGCFTSNGAGRDLIEGGTKRVTWNVQNNGTSPRIMNSDITICNVTDDPGCAAPYVNVITRNGVLPEGIETFTCDYEFESLKDYSVTLTTGESNSYNNDLKRFVFTTTEVTLITLSSFTTTPSDKSVLLKWTTESEIDNAGFNIYRSEGLDGEYIKINASLIPAVGTSSGGTYQYLDTDVVNRTAYFYKLENVDIYGDSEMNGPRMARPRFIYGLRE